MREISTEEFSLVNGGLAGFDDLALVLGVGYIMSEAILPIIAFGALFFIGATYLQTKNHSSQTYATTSNVYHSQP